MKKGIFIIITAALLAAVFSACASTQPATGVSTAGDAAASTDTTAPEASGAQEQVTVRFALWDYDLYLYDRAMMEAFMERYPHITVDVISTPNIDFDTRINVMMAGGEHLDALYPRSVPLFGALVARGQLADIAPLIERDGIDLEPYGAAIPAFMSHGDRIYGLPYRYDRFIMYYNKDIFDDAGIPYPSEDMTWEDYRELAMRLTSGEGIDKIYGAFFGPSDFFFNTPGLQYGLPFDTMDMERWREGWTAFYNMMYVDGSAQDWPSLRSINADQTHFLNGRAAMTINGSWFMNLIITELRSGRSDIRWGAQRVPVSESLSAQGVHGTRASVTPVSMTSNAREVEATWQLMQFIASEEGASILASHLITPGYFSETVFDVMMEVEGFDPSARDAMLGSPNAFPTISGVNEHAGELARILVEEIELLFTQNQDVDEAIRNLEARRAEVIGN